MLKPHSLSNTRLEAVYTLSVLTFTKILRSSKFIVVIQTTELEATSLNTGCQEKASVPGQVIAFNVSAVKVQTSKSDSMPGSWQCGLHTLYYLFIPNNLKKTVDILILQRIKLKLRKLTQISQCHTDRKWKCECYPHLSQTKHTASASTSARSNELQG